MGQAYLSLDISNSIISDSNAVNVISDELSSYLTIIAPEMLINEDQIMFNEVPLNETAKYTLQIANAGLTLSFDTITFLMIISFSKIKISQLIFLLLLMIVWTFISFNQ